MSLKSRLARLIAESPARRLSIIEEAYRGACYESMEAYYDGGKEAAEDALGTLFFWHLWHLAKSSILRHSVCRLRGHDLEFEESGDAESGPCITSHCRRCDECRSGRF